MDKKDDSKIWSIVERLKKESAKKMQNKSDNTHEQFNLILEEDTPETTIKRTRNSKPRGKKPAQQNLNNEKQQTLHGEINIEKEISEMRANLSKNIEEEKQNKQNSTIKNKQENTQKRISKLTRRLKNR